MENKKANIDRSIFYPESLAVVGATSNPIKFGNIYLRALLEFGYSGRLYPVNPRGGDLMGLKVYKSLAEIDSNIDLVCISVPAEQVPGVLRDCLRKGVKGAQILSAGFREAGDKGRLLEKEIVEISRRGIRLIGPNCFGIYSPAAGITLMPAAELSREPGPVGFFSQSGGGSCDLGFMAQGRGVKFSVMVSYGNGCDVEAAELLDYFRDDPETKYVAAYIEGVRDAREFFRALKSCASVKPVVIYKGGLSEAGQRGTMSHTGSMAGSRETWRAALEQAGAISASSLKDAVECLMTLVALGQFTGDAFGIMAGGGARNVEALDAADEHGFRVPPIPDEVSASIGGLIPAAGGGSQNPVDLANPAMSAQVISKIMEILAERPDIDALMLYQVVFYFLKDVLKFTKKFPDAAGMKVDYHPDICASARSIRDNTGKPLVLIMSDIPSDPDHMETEKGRWEARKYYCENGIPVFDHPDAAFSVIRRIRRYYQTR